MSEREEGGADAPVEAGAGQGVNRRRFLKLAGGAALAAGAAPALAGGASAAALPGSGARSRARTRKTGTINVFVAAQTQAPQAQQQLMNRAKQIYEHQHPGWTMSWDTYASAGEELTKIATSAAAHEGPDIFEVGLVPSAYGTGAFEIITKDMWNELGGKSSFLQGQFGYAGPDADHLIGIPENANPLGGMLYNKSYFKKAGIKKPPTTWNEFVHYAKEMTDANSNRWGATLDPADGFDPWHHVWLFATQMGG
ncbi:MAG: extracellular solute-binding protein, partial [Candidatus Dormibacteraeota bacterium]|nr:extracellular solute-binding protein [Candidatus Dormibacteraeota bacterium]